MFPLAGKLGVWVSFGLADTDLPRVCAGLLGGTGIHPRLQPGWSTPAPEFKLDMWARLRALDVYATHLVLHEHAAQPPQEAQGQEECGVPAAR